MKVKNQKVFLAIKDRFRAYLSVPWKKALFIALLVFGLLLPLWVWAGISYQKQFIDAVPPATGNNSFRFLGLVMIALITSLIYLAVYQQAQLEARITQRAMELEQELAARQQAEALLARERALLRTLIDLLPDSIYVKDLEGRKTLANPVDVMYMGVETEAEALGKSDFDVYPEEMAARFSADDRRILETETPLLNREEPISHPDGTRHWLLTSKVPLRDSASGEIIGLVGVGRDITARKRAEEALAMERKALRQSEERYRQELEQRVRERTAELQLQYARLDAILRSTTDGIIVTDAEGGILHTNPVAQTWLTQTLSPADAENLRETVRQVAAQSPTQPATVLELSGLDLELSAAPLAEASAEQSQSLDLHRVDWPASLSVVVAIHDVTHLKALTRMQTSFISHVSHELRTPVATIKAYLDLLEKRPEERSRYLAALSETADYQMRLVESILYLSRIDAGRLELKCAQVDLNQLVGQSVAKQETGLARSRHVRLRFYPARIPLLINADADHITRVINNLVENALLYTPSSGEVIVTTSKEVQDRKWAWVRVTDTGIGVSKEEVSHLFQRFWRGKQAQCMLASGAGLGLALVKAIVELHGGYVTVESEENVGSVFTVWLPLA